MKYIITHGNKYQVGLGGGFLDACLESAFNMDHFIRWISSLRHAYPCACVKTHGIKSSTLWIHEVYKMLDHSHENIPRGSMSKVDHRHTKIQIASMSQCSPGEQLDLK